MSAPSETPRPRIWVWPFLALLWLYKFLLSPLLHLLAPGAGCRYRPTCSEYAVGALRQYGLLRGTWLSLRRFLDCHPWGHFGHDPVPPEWPGWWRRRKHYYAHGAEAPENQACDGPHAGSTHLF